MSAIKPLLSLHFRLCEVCVWVLSSCLHTAAHDSCYPSVANQPWHSFSRTPPCLCFLLHLSSALPVALDGLPQVNHTILPTFIPLLSSAYLHLSRPPFLLLPTLTTDHNIVYEHFSPWRLPSALICQPVHHHCRRSGSKSISDVIPPPLGNHLSLPIQYGILVLRLGSGTRRTLACGNVGVFLEFSCESAEISDALNSFHLNF